MIAIASLAITIYVLLGSLMFPSWWYGLFWGPHARIRYLKTGLANLIDHYFRLSIYIIIVFSAAVIFIASDCFASPKSISFAPDLVSLASHIVI